MLGIHGIVSFDWILPDEGGQALILECNGRPVSWLHMVEDVGLDLAGAVRALRTGERPWPSASETAGEEIAIFPQDAIRAISLSDWKRLASWLYSPPGPLPWNEPRLFAADIRLLTRRLAQKIFSA